MTSTVIKIVQMHQAASSSGSSLYGDGVGGLFDNNNNSGENDDVINHNDVIRDSGEVISDKISDVISEIDDNVINSKNQSNDDIPTSKTESIEDSLRSKLDSESVIRQLDKAGSALDVVAVVVTFLSVLLHSVIRFQAILTCDRHQPRFHKQERVSCHHSCGLSKSRAFDDKYILNVLTLYVITRVKLNWRYGSLLKLCFVSRYDLANLKSYI